MRHTLPQLLLLFFLGWYECHLSAQIISNLRVYETLTDRTLNVEVASNEYPQILSYPTHGSVAKYKLNFESQYRLRYTPNPGFEGLDTVIFRTTRARGGVPMPSFEGFIVVVEPIKTAPDYYTTTTDARGLHLPVLENDQTISNELQLSKIAYVQNGKVTISEDGKSLIFDAIDEGFAHVSYVVCNNHHCKSGRVIIRVDQPTDVYKTDTFSHAVYPGEPAVILLAKGHQAPASLYYDGQLEKITSQIYHYTPKWGSLQTTTLRFSRWKGNTLTNSLVTVEVIDPTSGNGLNQEDLIFTEVNNPIIFDVTKNDLTRQVDEIISDDVRGTVTSLANGQFRFDPATNFSGQTAFFYKSCSEGRCDTARVLVTVHDFAPKETFWTLQVNKNLPLKLTYDVPIDQYKFDIISSPANGELELLPDGQSLSYQPNLGFVGNDAAVLKYCVQNAGLMTCHAISVFFAVVDFEPEEHCDLDCVWPGDINDDGLVDLADLLPLGMNLGATGPIRKYPDDELWYGQLAPVWNGQPALGIEKLQSADANGDGLISIHDLDLIVRHYDKCHRIVASAPLALNSVPLDIKLLTPEVSEGQEAMVEISVDSQEILDEVLGLHFSIDIYQGFVDSSTIRFDLDPNGAFDANSGTLSYAISPKDGQLDVAIVHTNRKSVVRHGVIGQITFIVEEDLNGFRSLDDLLEIGISVQDVLTLTKKGDPLRLPSSFHSMNYQTNGTLAPEKLSLFPNPAEDLLNLVAPDQLHKVEFSNMHGQLVASFPGNQTSQQILDISQLPPGFFLLRVYCADGSQYVRKIVIEK